MSGDVCRLATETSEHAQVFIFGELKGSSCYCLSCLLYRWRISGIRWTDVFTGLCRVGSMRLVREAGGLFYCLHLLWFPQYSEFIGNYFRKEILFLHLPKEYDTDVTLR